MTANKFVWKIVIGSMVALSACAESNDDSQSDPIAVSSSALTIDAGLAPVLFGDVIANNGYAYQVGFFSPFFVGSTNWNNCSAGSYSYSLVGNHFTANGFWLCARPDAVNRTFYVGDVENNFGQYYRVTSAGVTTLASQSWNTCLDGSTLLGTRFESNGFWVCMK